MAQPHPSLTTPFGRRAEAAAHPLTAYLYRLMECKASNLCLSADVASARELLVLADRIGPSIVVLKTHYDLVAGWDYHPQTGTGAQLAALARKHGFLLFEDRKFADIGKTVQQQYTAGTARIIDWAHLVTVNMDAGPAAVTALADAAARWRERVHYEVKTSVTVGTPVHESFARDDDDDDAEDDSVGAKGRASRGNDSGGNDSGAATPHAIDAARDLAAPPRDADGRKGSIVSITTVTQHFEPVDSPRLPRDAGSGESGSGESGSGNGTERNTGVGRTGRGGAGGAGGGNSSQDAHGTSYTTGTYRGGHPTDAVFAGIEEPPLARGILLLAQMSTQGNLMTQAYTQACVAAARAHPAFVAGFIAQESLNSAPGDEFVHLTPGCKLPPAEEEEEQALAAEAGGGRPNGVLPGDGMGQQYNTPARLIGTCGADIVIVGRGIITAVDPPSEAERYRRKAWKAYQARVQQ
ncbi:orotidine-5 -phosphate decarboxylase [Niveomyces insectorum RCEF 264]|uniref:Orotidine 5'-phosphate decarboxylase n=1 Tax=Niveomyces insectorum RCEF 264 TaxID=1081102 RepID=A0A167ZA80_9HYPO|nr:orotidine-5 -phosphate decarboxylase [Niveomyces insectorum RCEF 264]